MIESQLIGLSKTKLKKNIKFYCKRKNKGSKEIFKSKKLSKLKIKNFSIKITLRKCK